jgi:predicted transcriptional regulator
MRRSKLSLVIDILSTLSKNSHLKFTHIMHKTNINNVSLREYLDFLVTKNLIEKKSIGRDRDVFVITQRGSELLKQFKIIEIALPEVVENEFGNKTKESERKEVEEHVQQ